MTRVGTFNPVPVIGDPPRQMSAGRWLTSTRYLVGWPEVGVVKVGSTMQGRRRYGVFLSRGAQILDLSHYERLMDSLHAEYWLMHQLGLEYPSAFRCRYDAVDFMPKGAGWTECFAIGTSQWERVIELAHESEGVL